MTKRPALRLTLICAPIGTGTLPPSDPFWLTRPKKSTRSGIDLSWQTSASRFVLVFVLLAQDECIDVQFREFLVRSASCNPTLTPRNVNQNGIRLPSISLLA